MQSTIRISLVKQASAPMPALARAVPVMATLALALCGGCADTHSNCGGRLSRINFPIPAHAAPLATISPAPAGAP